MRCARVMPAWNTKRHHIDCDIAIKTNRNRNLTEIIIVAATIDIYDIRTTHASRAVSEELVLCIVSRTDAVRPYNCVLR